MPGDVSLESSHTVCRGDFCGMILLLTRDSWSAGPVIGIRLYWLTGVVYTTNWGIVAYLCTTASWWTSRPTLLTTGQTYERTYPHFFDCTNNSGQWALHLSPFNEWYTFANFTPWRFDCQSKSNTTQFCVLLQPRNTPCKNWLELSAESWYNMMITQYTTTQQQRHRYSEVSTQHEAGLRQKY